ncbi:hypothetical protein ACMBCN_00640 [Candidatus Liberibacter asiaticus]
MHSFLFFFFVCLKRSQRNLGIGTRTLFGYFIIIIIIIIIII